MLAETIPILKRDLLADAEDVHRDLVVASQGTSRLEAFNLHLKAAIRSLFGMGEAFANSTASAVLKAATASPTAIGNADLAVLLEREYDESSDLCLPGARRYSLLRRLEVSSRLFLQACGAPALPSWPDELVADFKALTRARNRFTHPKKLEDLFPTPAFENFRQVSVWLPAHVLSVLANAAERFGLPYKKAPEQARLPPLQLVPSIRPEDIFDSHLYNRVFSDPAAAIQLQGN
jgi:hypothetical protein